MQSTNFLKVLIHGLFNRFFINLNKLIKLIDLKDQKVGLIKFRSKKSHSDYFYINNVKLSYSSDCKSESYVKIPKVGKVQFRCKNIKSELLNGKIKSATIKRTKTGVYKISLLIEINKIHEDRKDNKHIGLDFSRSKALKLELSI